MPLPSGRWCVSISIITSRWRGHYYSVPYALVKPQLEARISAHTVELFHQGKRVASHRRSPHKGRHTTVVAHMPKAHQHYAEWTPQRLIHWAEKTGGATAQVVASIRASRPPPQQGFRACLGIMRLGKRYGDDRLEAACRTGLWSSGRVPTRVSTRFSSMISTANPCRVQPKRPYATCIMSMSVVPSITIKKGESPCSTILLWTNFRP